MVRSGETNQLTMKKFGSQMLGHTWDPTLDESSFKLHVDVSTEKEKARGKHKLITMDNFHELKDMKLTRRLILAIVAAWYDPLGLICPITIRLKIELSKVIARSGLGWDDELPAEF